MADDINDPLAGQSTADPLTGEPIAPIAPPQPVDETAAINVRNPEGHIVSIPKHQAEDAYNAGFQPVTDAETLADYNHDKYGSATGMLKSAGIGALDAATFGAGPSILEANGLPRSEQEALTSENPISNTVGQVGSLVGTSLIGLGEGAVLNSAGEAGAAALGLAAPTTALAKIGSGAVKAAIENATLQGFDETAKLIHDPESSLASAAANVGLAGLIGAPFGAGIGAVSPLWEAASKTKLASQLKAITGRLGGIEGVPEGPMDNLIAKTGVDLPPAIRSQLSGDPAMQQIAKTLEQSDTTSAGKAYQADLAQANKGFGDALVTELGHDPATLINKSDISQYESGKSLGNTLADEVHEQVSPLSDEYNKFRDNYASLDLHPSIADRAVSDAADVTSASKDLAKATKVAQKAQIAGDPGAAIEAAAKVTDAQGALDRASEASKLPGTADTIADNLGQRVLKEGWQQDPDSATMRVVGKVQKQLPRLNSLGDLTSYIKTVGEMGAADPANGPLNRAVGIIKGILRDSESDVLGKAIGSEEGPAVLEKYQQLRKDYAGKAQLTDALDERLHTGGKSTSGYADSIRTMAKIDGESVMRRLSGKGDADLLGVLQTNFPKTADALKQYHVRQALGEAASKAKVGENINTSALIKSVESMSPELRNFAFPGQALDKIKAVDTLTAELRKLPHNFSNTARVSDALGQHMPGSALGLATAVLSHSPLIGTMIGSLTKTIGKDIPDAVKYSLLKMMGSSEPINAVGFKTMTDMMHNISSGENLINRGVKAVFKTGREVLPQSVIPSQSDRDKLDKQLKSIQKDPSQMNKVGGQVVHYMPDHGQQLSSVAAGAVSYVNSQRPVTARSAPLDSPNKPSSIENAKFQNILNIALSPQTVISKIPSGRITPADTQALQAMYPALYNKYQQKLTNEMIEHTSKGNSVPYTTKLGLSMFMGQPLDSTMTAAGIVGAQPKQPQQSPQSQPGKPPAASSVKGLAKLPNDYKTATQAREQSQLKT